ncbi:MAG: hypothetical protein L6Q29_04610 [Candidatus Pacebacteria bacterium]|nr:hypothetical protein [Candidatus Paceibacterota bacterium]MCK6623435.1 hypothetical protein [Calditrichia bacterium]NUQ44159.1 hypothetical protein [Calditrichaceae bacterium]
MKICERHSHLDALEKMEEKDGILEEIEEILTDTSLYFGRNNPKEINVKISGKFNSHGWADRVRVGNSKLTISFLKSKVGVCVQLGNVARTYADILKLSQLGKKKVIDVGIIVVPDKVESRLLGANYARYDRLAKEIVHFADIINTPILIIGLSN